MKEIKKIATLVPFNPVDLFKVRTPIEQIIYMLWSKQQETILKLNELIGTKQEVSTIVVSMIFDNDEELNLQNVQEVFDNLDANYVDGGVFKGEISYFGGSKLNYSLDINKIDASKYQIVYRNDDKFIFVSVIKENDNYSSETYYMDINI